MRATLARVGADAQVSFAVPIDPVRLPLGPSDMRLRVFREGVAASIRCPFTSGELLRFVLRAAAIAESSSGVRIVESTVGTGACPVCGVHVSQGICCPDCCAPHHADCWSWVGRCCIYGCGGAPRSCEFRWFPPIFEARIDGPAPPPLPAAEVEGYRL